MTKVYSTCGEVFNYDTPDFDEGDHYYSGDKVEIKPSDLLFSNVSALIDSMEEQLYERVGDIGEGSLSYEKGIHRKATKLLEKFVDENFSVGCYAVENIEEHIMKEEK